MFRRGTPSLLSLPLLLLPSHSNLALDLLSSRYRWLLPSRRVREGADDAGDDDDGEVLVCRMAVVSSSLRARGLAQVAKALDFPLPSLCGGPLGNVGPNEV